MESQMEIFSTWQVMPNVTDEFLQDANLFCQRPLTETNCWSKIHWNKTAQQMESPFVFPKNQQLIDCRSSPALFLFCPTIYHSWLESQSPRLNGLPIVFSKLHSWSEGQSPKLNGSPIVFVKFHSRSESRSESDGAWKKNVRGYNQDYNNQRFSYKLQYLYNTVRLYLGTLAWYW